MNTTFSEMIDRLTATTPEQEDYRPMSSGKLLARNMLIYGLGGVITPFVGIKIIDTLIAPMLTAIGMLGIGLNYIRFAIEEPHLFRFLFQSNFFNGTTLLEMIDAEELAPVLLAMQGAVGGSIEQVKEIFLTVFLFAHGYASIIANNSLEYDEELIKSHLERAYRGAILATQEETK